MQKTYLAAPSASRAIIAGGGTMGADVAVVLLRAQCAVVVVEPLLERHGAIRDQIQVNLDAIGAGQHIGKLGFSADLDQVDWTGVTLLIECIPENLAWKQALFKSAAQLAPENVVLASNSSSFPISAIAEGLETRERMIGLHFFMPAHIVPLVEVVLGPDTDPAVGEALYRYMRRCGSVPIMVRKDIPGFIANRLQHALGREAFSLIQEGVATPEDIDAAVRFGFGFRYVAAGPVMQKEHAGLDIHAAAAATIYPTLSNAAVPPPVLADKPAQGKLGMKTKEGFYRWTDESIQAERQRYNRALRAGLDILGDDLPDIEP